MTQTRLLPIPQPPKRPLTGHTFKVSAETTIADFMRFAQEEGPIYELQFPGRKVIIVSSFQLVDELCDEQRFDKKIHTALQYIRAFTGDGLFTAHTHEPNWREAHHILLPNFSLRAMRNYFPQMLEIAGQLVDKWDKVGPENDVDVPADMTRLTLDTIGLCGFDYRFNSFASEKNHPFIQHLISALTEALERLRRLPLTELFLTGKHRRFQEDIDFMNKLVDQIIQERKADGQDLAGKQDLLSYMLDGVDKESGEGLSDLNIRYQIITFLIAGHETTSGLLSFALYLQLKHPAVLRRAYAEVDQVLGSDLSVKPTLSQVSALTYVSQILNEALRLYPPAPIFAVYPYEDTVIGGKYKIPKDQTVYVLAPALHRDKSVWGENAELFDPENFNPARVQERPANAFKPFGNGQRACIGRQFAMQEATLVLGMLLQRYNFVDAHNYEFKIKETLTIKPDNFKIRLRPRTEEERQAIAKSVHQEPAEPGRAASLAAPEPVEPVEQHDTPLLVLYGSNMGTAEDLAARIATEGEAYGYAAAAAPLDDWVDRLPREGAVVIVTASYNGRPPDNAVQFCRWLDSGLAENAVRGVTYTVFGCGHRDWAATFQAIPRYVDERLAGLGATRLYERGEGDAGGDFYGQFERWVQPLWAQLADRFGLKLAEPADQGPLFDVQILTERPPNPFVEAFGAKSMVVVENRELQQKTERSTRHLELVLPDGVSYRAGDHLGVIGRNQPELVQRVAQRFGFDQSTVIQIRKSGRGKTHLPVDRAIAVYDLLAEYVELQEVATQQQLAVLAEHNPCPPEQEQLQALAESDEAGREKYQQEVLLKRKSVLDLLEEFPAGQLSFNLYLEMLPALRPRYYSISSSPLQQTRLCSITVGVVDGPARSGRGRYRGMCSNFLAGKQKGDAIYAFVRDTGSDFRLPADPLTPVIMIGPGTGLAPFRGFLQERAALKAGRTQVGPSLLFFGCRRPDEDFIYEAELKELAEQGVTELFTAFSRVDPAQKVYVLHRLGEQQARVWTLLEQGAVVYVCGDASRMEPDVRQALLTIYQAKTGHDGAAAQRWLDALAADKRYLVDVWAAG